MGVIPNPLTNSDDPPSISVEIVRLVKYFLSWPDYIPGWDPGSLAEPENGDVLVMFWTLPKLRTFVS